MGVRVVRVPSALVDRRKPCRPSLRDPFGEDRDQPAPLPRVQFARQSHRDFVDDPGVLAVLPFFPIQPAAGGVALLRHPSGENIGAGFRAGDVADMRARRPGRVGGLADAAKVQAVDRHPSNLPAGCGRTQAGNAPVHRKTATAGGCNGGRAPLPRGFL